MKPRKPIRAFTLVELLTVIAVIGILAAILVPVISGVRDRATKAKSVSNLHQIGAAMLMYASANQGNIVPAADLRGNDRQWYILLSPYAAGEADNANDTDILEVFWDPGWEPETTSAGNTKTWLTGFGFNALPYSNQSRRWNKIRPGQDDFRYFKMNQLEHPGRRIAVAPSTFYWVRSDGPKASQLRDVDSGRYDGNPPYLMFDGHVTTLTPEQAATGSSIPAPRNKTTPPEPNEPAHEHAEFQTQRSDHHGRPMAPRVPRSPQPPRRPHPQSGPAGRRRCILRKRLCPEPALPAVAGVVPDRRELRDAPRLRQRPGPHRQADSAHAPGFPRAGLPTACTGKMHLDVLPPDWGVDYISSSLRGENWRVCGGGGAYSDWIQAKGHAHPNDQTHGWVPNRVPPSGADPSHPLAVQCSGRSDIPEEHSIERWAADEAIRFLEEERDPARPFWLWLSFDRPHGPHSVSPPWCDRHRPETINLGDFPDVETLISKQRKYLRDLDNIPEFTDETLLRRIVASYFNLIEQIDYEIGQVLDKLKTLGLYDDTVVTFCADHGDRAGVLRLNNKPGCTTDQINHVPLIIKPPAAADPGRREKATVRLIDLWPTLAELCGLPLPDSVEGASLAPAFRGEPLGGRTAVTDGLNERAVIRDGWALYTYWQRHRYDELYHLAEDPEERRNLGPDAAFAAKRQELKVALIREISQPFDEEDSEIIDRIVFGEELPRGMWKGPANLKKDPSERFVFIEFAGMWMVAGDEFQLFLRLDGQPSRAYRLSERDSLEDCFEETTFRDEIFETLLDALLDHLVETTRPVSASNHYSPDDALERPSRAEAEAFLKGRTETQARSESA